MISPFLVTSESLAKLKAFMDGPRPIDPKERRLWKILNHGRNYKASKQTLTEYFKLEEKENEESKKV